MNSTARLIAHLESGGWLLTQNLRQSRILRRLHDRAQIAAGVEVWPSALVLPFDSWLEQAWQEAAAARPELPALLRPSAAEWLWRQQAAHDAPGLVDPADLGVRARASWARLRAHGGDVSGLLRWPLTRDQQAFVNWGRAVEQGLRGLGAWDPADLARLIVEAAALPAAGPPVMLTGFRRLTPAQSALVTSLRVRGWTVDIDEPPVAAARTWQHAAQDPVAEQAAMLAWSRAALERQPHGIHGLILPDLASRRSAIDRALSAALQPELEVGGGAARDRVFDLAGGHPLGSRPVVEAALTTLECLRGSLDWAAVSGLLRSPYIAAAQTERGARIRLDLDLRSTEPRLQWPIASLLARARAGAAPEFARALAAAVASQGPSRRPAGAWAEAFGACLAAWGWPGGSELDSSEFQAAREFGERLRDLARLDSVAPGLAVDVALRELHHAVAAPFQPERGEPSVFVLDTLDDPGIRFDSLWVAGLTAATWPRPAAVDPLLPIEAQRSLAMPGVTAEDSVAEARAVMRRWATQSDELVLSWPRRENDTDVDGSPLIPDEAPALLPPPALLCREQLMLAARSLEPLAVDPAPPRPPGAAKGGARLLELQSKCPFRAFAELRLGAKPMEEPGAGIDRLNRGIILHRALHGFWSATRTHGDLLQLDAAACGERVAAHVDEALAGALPATTSARSLRLERDWQLRAIANLLVLERERPDFVVAEAERSMECELGGLVLRLQVDRVDRIGDALVVIDYKTGTVSPSQWRGARMDAPQLPLYAVLHPGRPAGIAVAAVSAAQARIRGVAAAAGLIGGMQEAGKFELTEDRERGFGWRQVTQHWWAWLDALAREHVSGCADVDPKMAAATCRTCHLGALCRVASTAPDEAEPVEAPDDD